MKELHENGITNKKVESEKEHLNSSCSNDGNTGCSFLELTEEEISPECLDSLQKLAKILVSGFLLEIQIDKHQNKQSEGSDILPSINNTTVLIRESGNNLNHFVLL
jgi:hypothetical protein